MYPSNSRKSREPEEGSQKKLVKKVISGRVTKRQKPLLMRIFGDNTKSVGSYILWDVLIPAAKNTITEMISNGIEMLVYGEPRSSSRLRRDRGTSYVSYGSFSREKDRDRDRRSISHNKARHVFDDIILERRSDAEEVLSNLVDLIEDYGQASIADFYGFVGLETEWSDFKYGWENLNRAEVRRIREGYILELPRPVELE